MSVFDRGDTGFIIQARLGSSRLPGKALLFFRGSTIIGSILDQLIEAGVSKTSICIATSTSKLDDVLSLYLEGLGYRMFRGDEEDVLSRFQGAAVATEFKNIIRLTGDNPRLNLGLI